MGMNARTRLFFLFLIAFLTALAIPSSGRTEEETSEEMTLAPSFLETPAPQEESTSLKQAEQLYNNCAIDPVVSVGPETDMAFCACAAAHVQEWFDRPENIKAQDSILGISTFKELNKDVLLSEVYGPCLHIPVYDLSYEDCYYDSKKHMFSNDPPRRQAFCTCIAEEDSSYFQDFAKPFLEMKIAQRKDVVDPVEEIKKDTNYYDARFFFEKNCYAKFSKKR